MELEEWKDVWNAQVPVTPETQSEALKKLLSGKSSSPVAKMKRNLNIELLLIIISYGLVIGSLEKYIRFYLVAGTALVPISLLFFGWLFHVKAWFPDTDSLFFPSATTTVWTAALAWFALTAILTTGLYFLNKWYVRTLYGKHVEKLRKVLDDMDKEV